MLRCTNRLPQEIDRMLFTWLFEGKRYSCAYYEPDNIRCCVEKFYMFYRCTESNVFSSCWCWNVTFPKITVSSSVFVFVTTLTDTRTNRLILIWNWDCQRKRKLQLFLFLIRNAHFGVRTLACAGEHFRHATADTFRQHQLKLAAYL